MDYYSTYFEVEIPDFLERHFDLIWHSVLYACEKEEECGSSEKDIVTRIGHAVDLVVAYLVGGCSFEEIGTKALSYKLPGAYKTLDEWHNGTLEPQE